MERAVTAVLIKPNQADGSVGVRQDAVVRSYAEAQDYLAWVQDELPGRGRSVDDAQRASVALELPLVAVAGRERQHRRAPVPEDGHAHLPSEAGGSPEAVLSVHRGSRYHRA
mgnify:CR=1 FL=1